MNSKIHLIIAAIALALVPILIITLALAPVTNQVIAQPKLDWEEQMDIYIEICRKDDWWGPLDYSSEQFDTDKAEQEHMRMLCYMYNQGMIDKGDSIS